MKPTIASFPAARPRRARQSPAVRALVRENTLTVDDLIWPVFVRAGQGIEEPVASMPGVMRRSVDRIAEAAREAGDENRARGTQPAGSACISLKVARFGANLCATGSTAT